MNKRDSFIFYRSFFEAIKILPNRDRLKVYDAIADYSLNFETAELTGTAKALFVLIQPQLEANNKRFANGSKAKQKQNGSKTEANKNNNNNKNDNKNGNGETHPTAFKNYMDVLDYLKANGHNNLSISFTFEGKRIHASKYGKLYDKETMNDLDRGQETRCLKYLMNNKQEL